MIKKFVNIKRVVGLVFLAIGIYLIIFAIHSMQKINEAKGTVKDVGDFFTKDPVWNPFVTFFGGAARAEISKYDMPVLLSLIGGIILVILGIVIVIVCKTKKSRH